MTSNSRSVSSLAHMETLFSLPPSSTDSVQRADLFLHQHRGRVHPLPCWGFPEASLSGDQGMHPGSPPLPEGKSAAGERERERALVTKEKFVWLNQANFLLKKCFTYNIALMSFKIMSNTTKFYSEYTFISLYQTINSRQELCSQGWS